MLRIICIVYFLAKPRNKISKKKAKIQKKHRQYKKTNSFNKQIATHTKRNIKEIYIEKKRNLKSILACKNLLFCVKIMRKKNYQKVIKFIKHGGMMIWKIKIYK